MNKELKTKGLNSNNKEDSEKAEICVVRVVTKKVVNEKEVVDYLDSLGMKHSNLGFGYLIEAILGKLEGIYKNGTCNMYNEIGNKFNTTGSRVERAIRHSIEASSLAEVTCSEFIARSVAYFKYK